MRLKIKISYDGRPFSGWQSQPCGNTVQDAIHSALREIAKVSVRVHASGRTDTGVHALGQTAHFDSPAGIDMNSYNWVPAINSHLPPTIRILDCEEVPLSFHARFSATTKHYYYDLCTDPILPPLKAGLAWHLPRGLDSSALTAALQTYVGRHNFQAFGAYRGNETAETDYTREIYSVAMTTLPDGYRMHFEGDGFLYKMVRLLTGAAVKTAQGRMLQEDLAALLDQSSDLPYGKSPVAAPPDGLYLEKVAYEVR